MKRLRRTLLEIWILAPLAALVGFMGPFGTYLNGDLLVRAGRWSVLLCGAYILVRPTMVLWDWVARATRLPHGSVMIWGLTVSSVPMALIWDAARAEEIKMLGGYAGVLPFAWLCSLTILLVAWLAERADIFLLRNYRDPMQRLRSLTGQSTLTEATLPPIPVGVVPQSSPMAAHPVPSLSHPRLQERLGVTFGGGDILALESEDHYVRVHGRRGSELLLMRLRDAIAEMDDVQGEQTHRSWWVARHAIAGVSRAGRNMEIQLLNGEKAPVARDSIDRLEGSGFLPARAGEG